MLRPSKAVNIKWSHVEFASPLVLSKELALRSVHWVRLYLTVDFVGTGTTQRMVVIEPVVGECCIEKQFDAPRTGGVAETAVLSANLLSTVDCWKS
jgi:hypothetical protein